uniref:MSP domain-containing protein n=1 Tax=Meloidogyne hapla TaxID=6305 RepID=A0A1I8BL68_MELHA
MAIVFEPLAVFVHADGDNENFNILNGSNSTRYAFRILNENQFYVSRPMMGIIEPDSKFTVAVSRLNGPPGIYDMPIEFAILGEDVTEHSNFFGVTQDQRINMTLPLVANGSEYVAAGEAVKTRKCNNMV